MPIRKSIGEAGTLGVSNPPIFGPFQVLENVLARIQMACGWVMRKLGEETDGNTEIRSGTGGEPI